MNVLSIVTTGFVIGLGLAFGKDSTRTGQIVVLLTVTIGLATLAIAHRIFRRTIEALGTRIKLLENLLEMEKFETTRTLMTAIAVTRWVTIILLAIMLFLLTLVLGNWV